MAHCIAACGTSQPITVAAAIGLLMYANHVHLAATLDTSADNFQNNVESPLIEEPDETNLLQKPLATKASAPKASAEPHIIGLRRERVPIYRDGKTASFKTSYSGLLHVGTPLQPFRVVFDTGSGHLVLPAAECTSEACLVHRRYDAAASQTSVPINANGSVVPVGDLCDQVTIGYGTGEISGEFTLDKVCFGSKQIPTGQTMSTTQPVEAGNVANPATLNPTEAPSPLCVEMHMVVAVEMSSQPFKSFQFDGVVGMGLSGLSLTKNFSAFDMLLTKGKLGASRFGVYLTEDTHGEESEIAMGGYNPKRLLGHLSWTSVTMPELGHWLIKILAVRINGRALDICQDGSCRGIVDTGTSHLGIPAPYDKDVIALLTQPAHDMIDCLLVTAPVIQIELPGYNITLHPFNYMRRLPLRDGVSVDSTTGIYLPSNRTNKLPDNSSFMESVASATRPSSASPAPVGESTASVVTSARTNKSDKDETTKHFCKPRIMPVRIPEPLGPKLFILGEPLFHRYYTVFDWAKQQVGFGIANNFRNTMDPTQLKEKRGAMPKEVEMFLMQTTSRARHAEISRVQQHKNHRASKMMKNKKESS